MDCKRCGRQLNMTEIKELRDRCLPCYHKGCKFVLGVKDREILELTRKYHELQTENDRLSRGIDVVSREWKNSLCKIHELEANVVNRRTA